MDVQFAPPCQGPHAAGFVLVCDNCHVLHFGVSGTGCCVDVAATHLDGRPLAPGELQQPLWFGQLPPGAATSHVVTLRNSTSLPFPFCWREVVEGQEEGQQEQAGPQVLPAAEAPPPVWQLGGMDAAEAEQLLLLSPAGSQADAGGISRGSVSAVQCAGEFSALPPSGVLQPGEELEVTLTYQPLRVGRWAAPAPQLDLLPRGGISHLARSTP
jgi:hypothetical protein